MSVAVGEKTTTKNKKRISTENKDKTLIFSVKTLPEFIPEFSGSKFLVGEGREEYAKCTKSHENYFCVNIS